MQVNLSTGYLLEQLEEETGGLDDPSSPGC